MDEIRVLEDVAARLRRETLVETRHHRIELDCAAGELTLRGEVEDMRTKRVATRAAAGVPGVVRVIDRLAIRRSVTMTDGELRDRVRGALLSEPAFVELAVRERAKGETRVMREGIGDRGAFDIEVEEGALVLRGVAPSLSHQRLAVALAWWVPGIRNVVDELEVTPPERDDDGEIADALLMLFEKDPSVDPADLVIHVEDAVVSLRGWVTRRAARDAAERDAWLIESVRDVINEIGVAVGQGALR